MAKPIAIVAKPIAILAKPIAILAKPIAILAKQGKPGVTAVLVISRNGDFEKMVILTKSSPPLWLRRLGRLGSVAVFCLGLLPATALAAVPEQGIGVTSAVIPLATGQAPQAAERLLYIGKEMVRRERVVTAEDGRAHIFFLDGSALTVGAKSEVVLDQYVFDPEADTGKLVIDLTRGLLRFVGGKISKKQHVLIRSGDATIGIRGGIAVIEVGPSGVDGGAPGGLRATMIFGDSLFVETPLGRQTITRPGFTIEIRARNLAPAAPVRADMKRMRRVLSKLESSHPTVGPAGRVAAPGRQAPATAGHNPMTPEAREKLKRMISRMSEKKRALQNKLEHADAEAVNQAPDRAVARSPSALPGPLIQMEQDLSRLADLAAYGSLRDPRALAVFNGQGRWLQRSFGPAGPTGGPRSSALGAHLADQFNRGPADRMGHPAAKPIAPGGRGKTANMPPGS